MPRAKDGHGRKENPTPAEPSPDTIFAPASGAGRAAIAVIRISGPAARDAVLALAGLMPEPRSATLRPLRDPAGDVLDRALVLWFPAPRSFTGEDAAEFQVHGGRAVVAAVLRSLAAVPGCRPAEAGEFTRRALLNDRLDLAEVEGLADLIDAETEAQRRLAQRQFDGALGRWVEGLREDLLAALSLAEGAIDFAEEDDLAGAFAAEVARLVGRIRAAIDAEVARQPRATRLREGIVVAITGPPNAGKSTLLNALAGRDVAIVSAHAGTTRDAIEVALDLGGYPVTLVDTAGLRETADEVEREGIARARARAASADLVLWLHAPGDPSRPPELHEADAVWAIATKADLRDASAAGGGAISALGGQGIDGLVARLTHFAAESLVGGDAVLVTRLRHRTALLETEAALSRVAVALEQSTAPAELVAEDLRSASAALDGLVGRIGTEEVLGSIFARFCIGK